jgi:invasion protein IalB
VLAKGGAARLKTLGLTLTFAAITCFAAADLALAQNKTGSSSAAKKTAMPAARKPTAETKVAGSYGNWTLLCGKEGGDKSAKERCSLVLPLVEKETQKLVFRVIVTYGSKGKLVLRVDGPTGVALQSGVEFSPDTRKIYRMPFQTCLPMGCKALLLVQDDMRKEMAASKQGSLTVYALNGKAIKTVAALDGFTKGMAALDKRLGKQVSKKSKKKE